jgi:hypothetical protein
MIAHAAGGHNAHKAAARTRMIGPPDRREKTNMIERQKEIRRRRKRKEKAKKAKKKAAIAAAKKPAPKR